MSAAPASFEEFSAMRRRQASSQETAKALKAAAAAGGAAGGALPPQPQSEGAAAEDAIFRTSVRIARGMLVIALLEVALAMFAALYDAAGVARAVEAASNGTPLPPGAPALPFALTATTAVIAAALARGAFIGTATLAAVSLAEAAI
jgi:hypothetical protein